MAGDIGNKEALLQISSRFTEETLVTILKTASGVDNVELLHYTVSGGSTRSGDSLLSNLSRIKIEGKVNGKPYSVATVVKGLPSNIGRRKTFRLTDFFANEAAFFNEVVPKFMAFQDKKKPKKPFQEIPRCFYALADGENDFVVLEDVSVPGYITANRSEGVDFEHCAAILQTLGRFHALSLAMKDQDPVGFKAVCSSVKETYYAHRFKDWYKGQLKLFCEIAMDAVSREYPNSIYEEKLKSFVSETLYDRLASYAQPREPYAVIGHGDTWAPNFMFHYVNNKSCPESVQMIDFQLARYGSPILDLSFFLFSCTTQELRSSHFEELTKIYHRSLSDLLQDLGCCPDDVFSYEAFKKELSEYILFGLGFSLESVPCSVADETPNLDIIEGDEAVPLENIWKVGLIKSKSGRLRLAGNIKFAVDNGYL